MSFDTTTVAAPAKINWMLRVLGRRDDGFHDLETIFQSISIADSLTFRPASRLELHCNSPSIPTDESNLVWRAAELMMERFGAPVAAIELEKRIPAGAGLGGGSSDAAATMTFLAQFARKPEPDELATVALEIGSDVPFFIRGGTCYATGRGEALVRLNDQSHIPLVIAMPDERVMTGDAYAMLREARNDGDLATSSPIGLDICVERADRGLLGDVSDLVNDFEDVIFRARPRIEAAYDRVRSTGAIWTRMSGSGSAIIGAYESVPKRNRALEQLIATDTVIGATTIAGEMYG